MSLRCRRAIAPLLLLLVRPVHAAENIQVAAGKVEDQRVSDARHGGLTVELKLTGSSVAEVKALRAKLKSARDDTGSVLYKPTKDEKGPDFQEFSPDRHPAPSIRLSTPSRDASTFDVVAELELFIPARDPNARQRFEAVLGRLDRPILGSALKAAKVEITPLSPAGYKARQLRNRPTKEQIMAEGKKHGVSDAEIQEAIAMMDAIASLGGEEPSETSVLLETKDPDGKVMSIDLVAPDGTELPATGRSASGSNDARLLKIDLSAKPPEDAALLVTMRTAKSVVTVPLNLKEVALP